MRDETIALLLVIALLAGAGVGYFIGNANEREVTTTVPNERPLYEASKVNITVGCCPSIPSEFVVGRPGGNTYVFDVSYGPIFPIGHGPTITVVSGENMSIRVYQQNALPLKYQWANFTIAGTFNPYSLNHRNATLLDGAVVMKWVVVSSVLYLDITTK